MTEEQQKNFNKLKEELEFILLSHKEILPKEVINNKSRIGLNLINTICSFCEIPNKERQKILNWFLDEIKKMEIAYEKSKFEENPKNYILDILQKEFLFSELHFNMSFNNEIYLNYQGKEYVVKIEEKEKK